MGSKWCINFFYFSKTFFGHFFGDHVKILAIKRESQHFLIFVSRHKNDNLLFWEDWNGALIVTHLKFQL
jgi:hypothetical protein